MLIPRRVLLVAPAVLCSRTALAQPALNILDFQCFINRFAAGDVYANCDGSTAAPVLNALDFSCYIREYAARNPYADCDAQGWTTFIVENVYFVSSSTGSDSNPGTEAFPFRSLARGYAALRAGHADQLSLKCGDSWLEAFPRWTKGSNQAAYMVVTSYGTGPRPQLRTPAATSAFDLASGVTGLAIAHIDFAPNVRGGSNYAGINNVGGLNHFLVEGCSITSYPGNIVIQVAGNAPISDIKIRRNIIADSYDTGAGHSQGIFMQGVQGWAIVGNVFDANAVNKADIFCHNVYIQTDCSPGEFSDNISARASSHGVQQRPGGTMENNLFLRNPINAYQGRTTPGQNLCRWNVALDSQNINAIDIRGVGFDIGAIGGLIFSHNVIAHQTGSNGPYNISAVSFANIQGGATVEGNVIRDWGYATAGPPMACNAVAFGWYQGATGTIEVFHNKIIQRRYGQVIAHSNGAPFASNFNYHDNSYWTTNDTTPGCYSPFDWAPASGGSASAWRSITGDNSTFADPGPLDLTLQGVTGMTLAEFMAECRKQSRQNWRDEFTSDYINDIIRKRAGVQPN